ncbi:hypothetical protein B296_00031466 [Ensete ventricosum]|uniref:Uncharacterized protein n=1 Tax=Ensete ventricosum TaxID=4639 RepID=A0A427ACT1_ENSVE|nr:hypothetical protein B296_00031466 [Ensete ventricosum]
MKDRLEFREATDRTAIDPNGIGTEDWNRQSRVIRGGPRARATAAAGDSEQRLDSMEDAMGPQEQEEKGELALGFRRRRERGGRRSSKAEGRANLR